MNIYEKLNEKNFQYKNFNHYDLFELKYFKLL